MRRLSPWLVLAVGLAFTAASALYTLWTGRNRDELRFDNAVEAANDRIQGRLDVYRTAIRGGAALFAAREDVDSAAFHRYMARLSLGQLYPGVQGLGFTERVSTDPERHSIRYLEPLDERNQAAIGYDMYADPIRRAAMAHARDYGHQTMSGKVTLVQEIRGPVQPGFLIYSPVYRGGTVPASIDDRRRLLVGFVYSPFRSQDLFRGIFGSEQFPRVSFRVYDGQGIGADRLLYESPHTKGHAPAFATRRTMVVADHHWTIEYASEVAFEQAGASKLWFTLFIVLGVLASIWMFLFSRGQAIARDQAESASRAKGAFLATMSHELRTPLNAIGGYVDLLQLNVPGPTNEKQQHYLTRIQHAQAHLLGLINNVLNYSKLEARGVAFKMAAHRIYDVVLAAETLVTPQIVNKGLVYENLGGPDVWVRADAEKLTQILLNLLSNAVKFTPAGGLVRLAWEQHGSHAEIRVTDTGAGIPDEKLATIFEPFVQVESNLTRTQEGTGLGLSIAQQLARGMNAELSVSSELGKGSTFTVKLHCTKAPVTNA